MVNEDVDVAGTVGEEDFADCMEGGVGGFHVAIDALLFVERDDDEGDGLSSTRLQRSSCMVE